MPRARRRPEKRREQAIEVRRQAASFNEGSGWFGRQLDACFEAATGTV